jgi:hypothetical protein
MHKTKNLNYINKDLERTNKLIVAIGDSFTYGDAAWDDDLLNLYLPLYNEHKLDYNFYDTNIVNEIHKLYPETTYFQNGKLNFEDMFQKNSYLSIIDNKLNKEWTCLNLGIKARGNFSAISSLFLTNIKWNLVKEVVVIYMPSSMNRVDILNDTFTNPTDIPYNLFATAWPSSPYTRAFREKDEINIKNHGSNSSPWNLFQDSIYDGVWSEKHDVLKTILEFQFLNSWIKSHNGKLIVIPAFSNYYNKEYFQDILTHVVKRENISRKLIDIDKSDNKEIWSNYINMVPWSDIHHPDGYHSFYHYALGQTDKNANSADMLKLIGKPSKDNWIMACGHPSAKAHELIATYVLKYL